MRERAEELGGELVVEARPGQGTVLRLRLPTSHPAPLPAVGVPG
jgi:nitrate/nitrite-specific signal transduction histidine kinase